MKPSLEYLRTRLEVDIASGRVTWLDATKQHVGLVGQEAGSPRPNQSGKQYWHVKVDGKPIKRSHIVFLFATGQWPALQVDHINGNSLDDRFTNLREATQMQNAWNHKGRAKASDCPMGVRRLPSGRFQARIAVNKKQVPIGTYETQDQAEQAYQQKRKEFFGEYA